MLSQDLLDIICCPQCRGDLSYEPDKNILTCKECGRIYKIKDDIPVMLIDNGSKENNPE